jgi:hypothetical protein
MIEEVEIVVVVVSCLCSLLVVRMFMEHTSVQRQHDVILKLSNCVLAC